MRFMFLLSAAVTLLLASCQSGAPKDAGTVPDAGAIPEKVDSSKFTSIEWLDKTKDYGKIEQGQKLEVAFRFKNTGDKPLIIESVHPSCGCTVADPPKEPIAPGAEGEIKGSFDSNGKEGEQHKTLVVTANTKGGQQHDLTFTVTVHKK
ncbi:MAG: DUF1573 domain-containing protein [Bacteroidetes bacterium]|nr:DUF1573 domain-containing protein [Bacteroidota bacterium]